MSNIHENSDVVMDQDVSLPTPTTLSPIQSPTEASLKDEQLPEMTLNQVNEQSSGNVATKVAYFEGVNVPTSKHIEEHAATNEDMSAISVVAKTSELDHEVSTSKLQEDPRVSALKSYLTLGEQTKPLEAVNLIRTMVSSDDTNHDCIERIIDQGWIPKLLNWFTDPTDPILQYECAWTLTNIASDRDEDTQLVIDHGGIEVCAQILRQMEERNTSTHADRTYRQQLSNLTEQCIWLLRNITTNGVAACKRVLHAGVLKIVMDILQPISEYYPTLFEASKKNAALASQIAFVHRLLEAGVTVLTHLCVYQPQHPFIKAQFDSVLQLFWSCTHIGIPVAVTSRDAELSSTAESSASDTEILIQIPLRGTFGLSALIEKDGTADRIDAMLALPNFLTHMTTVLQMTFASRANWRLVWAILRLTSNLAFGHTNQVRQILEHKSLVPTLFQLVLSHENHRFMQREILWTISNLLALDDGTPEAECHHTQLMLDMNVMAVVRRHCGAANVGNDITNNNAVDQTAKAAHVNLMEDLANHAMLILSRLCESGSDEQRKFIFDHGGILACHGFLVDWQKLRSPTITTAFTALRCLLQLASESVWSENASFSSRECAWDFLGDIKTRTTVDSKMRVMAKDIQLALQELHQRPLVSPVDATVTSSVVVAPEPIPKQRRVAAPPANPVVSTSSSSSVNSSQQVKIKTKTKKTLTKTTTEETEPVVDNTIAPAPSENNVRLHKTKSTKQKARLSANKGIQQQEQVVDEATMPPVSADVAVRIKKKAVATSQSSSTAVEPVVVDSKSQDSQHPTSKRKSTKSNMRKRDAVIQAVDVLTPNE